MSGLSNRSESKYFNILSSAGKFTIPSMVTNPEAVARVNKNGETVYELHYQNFDGKLVGIETVEHEQYGKQWIFTFDAGGEIYTLRLGYTGDMAMSILKMLPNLDLSQSFRMSLSRKDEKTTLFISQLGNPVKHFYSKTTPNGMPEWKLIKVNGKDTWDMGDAIEFLEKETMEKIVPKLTRESVPAVVGALTNVTSESINEIPF